MTTPPPQLWTDSETEEARGKPLRLGRRLDLLVKRLRELAALLVGLPVAWVQLQPSVEALREHKRRRIQSGIATILAAQRHRTRPLDLFFQFVTFFHEEDCYLLLLPLLFWRLDYLLGIRLTAVVVAGLFVGNFIKDVYQLPRPSATQVWRPSNQEKLDSAALQDFGFPSTHAMNSLTNSFIIAWHYYYLDLSSPTTVPLIPAAACLVWIAILCLSRIYLGAHTTTDVRGGLSLGVIMWGFVLLLERDFVERQLVGVVSGGAGEDPISTVTPILSEPIFNLCALLFGTFALLMLPQPRPPTPTFHQNSMLFGLGWGLLSGARLRYKAGILVNAVPMNPVETGACILVGFIFLAVTRVVMKTLVSTILRYVLNIRLNPLPGSTVAPDVTSPSKRPPTARLFTRDVDILGVAIIKTLVYFSLAFSITYVVPVVVIPSVRRAIG